MTQSVRERERWKIAKAIYDGRINEAWKGSYIRESKLRLFPRTEEAQRTFFHAPAADVELALASADAVMESIPDLSKAVEALKAIKEWQSVLPNLRAEHHGPKCSAFDALSSCVEVAREAYEQLTRDKG